MKNLLVYYSYTGNTKIIADMIKEKIDCDVVQLQPKTPFLEEDYQIYLIMIKLLLELQYGGTQ